LALKQEIADLVTEPLAREGFDLIELKVAQYKTSHRVQLYVDSDHGVTIGDCVNLSRVVEPVLESSNIFSHGYTVEISSPGLDRPLKTSKDFRRRKGEKIRLFFADDDPVPVEGELLGADEEFIELLVDDQTKKYELNKVRLGKIIF
jgi:ribosome maturation factor RimP